MSEVAAPSRAPVRQIKSMETLVAGRIEARRRYENLHYTRIVTPAPDAYSHPATVEVRSKQSLGSVGDEVQQLCRVGGYKRKPYRVTDRDTGEVTQLTPVDHTLDAIE